MTVAMFLSILSGATNAQTWIYGLSGHSFQRRVQLDVLKFNPPVHSSKELKIVIKRNESASKELNNLLKTKSCLPEMTLLVRKNERSKPEIVYEMMGVTVSSIEACKGRHADDIEEVNLIFDRMESKMQIGVNPSLIAGAPPVEMKGINKGWIYGFSGSDLSKAIPVDIIEYAPPEGSGLLRVVLGDNESLWITLQDALQASKSFDQLILVLPDPKRKRYVEYKLWDAKVTSLEKAESHRKYTLSFLEAVFASNMVECFLGES
jgi:type VI protein secretion system component Hcp